jgi:protein SCO1/2
MQPRITLSADDLPGCRGGSPMSRISRGQSTGCTLEIVMRKLFAAPLLALIFLAGCHSGTNADQQAASRSSFKVYKLRGKVVSTNAATGEVTLDNEAIPGFMEAMIMPYKLKDPGILGELHPGDVLNADLFVSQGADAAVFLDHIDVIAQGKPDYRPTVLYHVPAPGDEVPDFKLRNQDGRAIHLDQFRGKMLLLTFIYTRCPLPNFCPLVTHNFAVINSQLAANPALYAKTHLVCVSFDPDHDTPTRLRAYGAEYIGSDARSAFAHWDFAAPAKPELMKMAQYFDVGLTPGADGTINHTLSTTLIGPHGKVEKFYPGNEWTPDQVLADVKRFAANAG